MITIQYKGNYKDIVADLARLDDMTFMNLLQTYGRRGVTYLSQNTPKRSGRTADSWRYDVNYDGGSRTWSIDWFNDNVELGLHIAVLIQYGHGTKNGGYVRPVDYINPAIDQAFSDMAERIWQEVRLT